ncbi:MAG: hypothetical protein LBD48_11300 [Treponema sp.]|jgi:hypothetical protein|nr:hypothetical protein [Treponema sp.]
MLKKSLILGMLCAAAAFVLFTGCENTAGVTNGDVKKAVEESKKDFVNTDPKVETLDKALTYFSKWMVSSIDGIEQVRLYQSVSFTPALFSVDYLDFGDLVEGKYAYKLAKDGAAYLLSVADWLNYAPNDPESLKPAARISYDPVKMEITFANVSGSPFQVWGDEGTVFAPDMTPYFEAAGIKASKWIHVSAADVPQAAAGYKADISFDADGAIITSDANQVFPTALNNKTNTWWGIIGKERKLIIGTGGADLGTVNFSPGKNLKIGDKKYANAINPCGYICDYRGVDCCPTINGTWAVTDGGGTVDTANPAYIAISGGARSWKANASRGGSDQVSDTAYGEGLASITAANNIFWVSGSTTTMLYSSDYQPLFELVDVSELLDNLKMTIKPAKSGAQNIILQKQL